MNLWREQQTNKFKLKKYSLFTICWKSQLRIIDVALLGRTPRFDDDDEDEISAVCFRFRVENESNNIDDESTAWEGPLAIICESGVWPLNSVVYGWQIEFKPLFESDCFLEIRKIEIYTLLLEVLTHNAALLNYSCHEL
jgi:hypothetical protein